MAEGCELVAPLPAGFWELLGAVAVFAGEVADVGVPYPDVGVQVWAVARSEAEPNVPESTIIKPFNRLSRKFSERPKEEFMPFIVTYFTISVKRPHLPVS